MRDYPGLYRWALKSVLQSLRERHHSDLMLDGLEQLLLALRMEEGVLSQTRQTVSSLEAGEGKETESQLKSSKKKAALQTL